MSQFRVSAIVALALACAPVAVFAQVTGPSSSAAPYVLPVAPGVQTLSLLTVGDSVNNNPAGAPYRYVGIPDGLGAYSNGDGTYTILVNHELGASAGGVRAHGTVGSFVSKWTLNAATNTVLNGSDLITSVAGVPGGSVPFGRFCSADLPSASAFFNPASNLGTTEKIFMKGEEVGNEGRAFGTIVSTGEAHYLPKLGRFSWENSVASPFAQNKTVVVGLDDSTPGQVYVYVGDKTNSGTAIDRAGLNNGKLYGIKTPVALETTVSGPGTGTATLVDLTASLSSGATLQADSVTAGVTEFARPEDGAWDPSKPNDFYFVTTGANTGTGAVNNRLYRMRFTDISQPELGGQMQLMFTGGNAANTALPASMDNLTVVTGLDGKTRVLIQEDPGNNDRLARIWQYTVDEGAQPLGGQLLEVAIHDPALFAPGAANLITRDEEASGIIPVWDILGPGWYLMSDQIHAQLGGELVEQGQLQAIFIPQSIPEPSALGLVAVAGAALLRRRK